MTIDDYFLLFGGKLDANNRWVKYAKIIPWDDLDL
jgi:IS5 family transposase